MKTVFRSSICRLPAFCALLISYGCHDQLSRVAPNPIPAATTKTAAPLPPSALGGSSSDVPAKPRPKSAIVPTDNVNGLGAAPAAGRFEVSADGAATYTYPVWVPPGRRGMQPSISVAYNSRQPNGPLGVGWSLQGLSAIFRCKRDFARDDGHNTPIQFDQTDVFCLDGQRLIAVGSTNGPGIGQYGAQGTIYHTEEERFIQIVNGATDSEGPLSFEVDYKDGRKFFYGTTTGSRLGLGYFGNESVRLRWALSEVRDAFNNNLSVQYEFTDTVDANGCSQPSPGEQLPASITYTGTVNGSFAPQRAVSFQYECRPDATIEWTSGYPVARARRLTGITLSAPSGSNPPSVVKSYRFSYQQSPANGRSLLSSVQECDGEETPICLPLTTFSYSQQIPDGFLDIDTGVPNAAAGSQTVRQIQVGDINGDGCDDFIYTLSNIESFISANYLLSSCYDSIAADTGPAFQGPPAGKPADYYQLSPYSPDAPDSTVPPEIFGLNPNACPGGARNCFSELLALDLDLDGRVDLFNHAVATDFDSNQQSITTNVFLASRIPPSQWTPASGLYGHDSTALSTGPIPPYALSATYHSLYIGDINGDGFPDFIHLSPYGWSFRLNHGQGPLCATSGNDACLNVGPESVLPFKPPANLTGIFPLFLVDLFNVGTTDLVLPDATNSDATNSQDYAAYFTVGSDQTLQPKIDVTAPTQNCFYFSGQLSCQPWSRQWFADINGDGLPDFIAVGVNAKGSQNTTFVFTNAGLQNRSGKQTGPAALFAGPQALSLADQPSQNRLFFDYDGDGTQDIIYSGTDGNIHAFLTGSNKDVTLMACSSASWSSCTSGTKPGSLTPIPAVTCNIDPNLPFGCLQAFDANGDGLADLIQTVNGVVHVYIRQGIKPDLLVRIQDRGALTSINYAPISSHAVYSTTVPPGVGYASPVGPPTPAYVVSRGLWVLKSYSAPRAGSLGPFGPVNTYAFSYQDGRRDLHGRGWLGFGTVKRTDLQTGVVTTTTYDNLTMLGSAYPYALKPKEIDSFVTLSASGVQHETRSIYTYSASSSTDPFTNQPDGKSVTVLLREVYEGEFEGQAENFGLIRSVDTKLDYDGYGNVTNATRTTGDGYIDTSTINYTQNIQFNPTLYLTSIPQQLLEASTTPPPNAQTVTRTTQFYPDLKTGVISYAIVEPNGSEALYRSTNYRLDPHGVFVGFHSTDRSGRQLRGNTSQYDPIEDLFPIAITNGVGHTDNYVFDTGLGVLAGYVDANGVVEQWKYDGFGRLKQVLAPDGANLLMTYQELTLRERSGIQPVASGCTRNLRTAQAPTVSTTPI